MQAIGHAGLASIKEGQRAVRVRTAFLEDGQFLEDGEFELEF